LGAGGWYLDCSCGFVPDIEKPLYNSLVCSAPEVIELNEEPKEYENAAPPTNDKEVALVKGKAKGKRFPSIQISTRSFTKASIQRTAAPATTVVGSPSAILSALPRTMLPFHPIAVSPSPACLARRRLLHRIHPPLLRRGRHLFF